MRRIKIVVAYVGTCFCGWQLQLKPGEPELRTVQGVLEAVVFDILGYKVRLNGSGRTDSGVHADAQVAHFDVKDETPPINWVQAMNRHLPDDVSVVDCCEVEPDFNARFDAQSKVYNYGLWLERRFIPPKLKPFVWATGPLDLRAMDKASEYLTGDHDFASFQNVGAEAGETVRQLYDIRRQSLYLPGTQNPPSLVYPVENPDVYTVWSFHGSGFLKQMVRNLIGLLVYAGQGRIKAEDIPAFFAAKDRRAMPGPTAPAKGLTLHRVLYE